MIYQTEKEIIETEVMDLLNFLESREEKTERGETQLQNFAKLYYFAVKTFSNYKEQYFSKVLMQQLEAENLI